MLTVLYFYLRAIRYSMMALEVAKKLGVLGVAEAVYKKTPEANSLLQRWMVGKFAPYGGLHEVVFHSRTPSADLSLVVVAVL